MQLDNRSKLITRQATCLWTAVGLGLIAASVVTLVVWLASEWGAFSIVQGERQPVRSQDVRTRAAMGSVDSDSHPVSLATTPNDPASEKDFVDDRDTSKKNDTTRKSETSKRSSRLKQLRKLTDRLSKESSRQSIPLIQRRLQTEYGTSERATTPTAVAPDGKFDYETAQLHDVKRAVGEDGKECFVSVMLDADGRVMDVEMPRDTGEEIYEIMQQVRSNPLLESVYREIAMPLLDKILKQQSK